MSDKLPAIVGGLSVLGRGCAVACALASTLFAACSSDERRAAGEECFASSECGAGLICDLTADPPVCAGMGAMVPVEPDAAASAPDIDASADAPDAGQGAPDAATPPDASTPDASPDAALPDAAPDASI